MSKKTALPLVVALGVAWSAAAQASPEEHAKAASDYVTSAARNASRVTSLSSGRTIRAISENLIDGELALRGRSFDEAITIFTKVLESTGPREGALYYNARFLRAQALEEHGEPGSAVADYQAVLAAAGQPGSGDYPVRAVDRLVGLGLARRDRELLKGVLGRAETLRIDAPDAEAAYARAKAYIDVGDAAKARPFLAQAGASKPLQTAYYEAMLVLREEAALAAPRSEAFPRALAAFEALAAQSPNADLDAASVVQLAKLAVARLRYERREFAVASGIYRSIGTSSPLFDQAAAELAWSQVQRGDSAGAERALELLAEARPRSGELAEGQLLRADLSLRNGSFGKALELYKSVRAVLEPQREAVDAYLKARPNPEDFYDLISKREMEIVGSGDKLPPLAIRVVRDDANGRRAIDVAADIGLVRGLVEQLQRRAKILEGVASDPNRAVNLAEFRGSSKELTAVANQVARGRLEVALGLDDANLAVGSDELAQVRERRKLLMPLVEQLPLTVDALSARGDVADDGLSRLSDALLRADREASALLDQIEKMRDLVRRDEERGVERDPQARARVLANLDIEAQALIAQRDLVRDTQRVVEELRAGAGGEAGLVAMEASARREFNALVDREVELVSASLASSTYGARVKTTIVDAKRVDAELDRLESELKAKASDRAAAVQAELAQRLAQVTELAGRLDDLEKDARAVCGGVARANVQVARKQLRDLLLKADVGVTAHAWEVREEQQHRVNTILAEKSKRERLVNEEMRDALEDGSVAVFKETNAPPR